MSTPPPRFDAERARAASARVRYTEIREALEEVNVRAESRDGTFSVDMGVGGAIVAVNLTDAAMAKTPEALSRALLETINTGMRQIAARTNEIVAPYLSGADLDLAAITSGRLPAIAQPPAKSALAREIEAASAIPKRPLGRFAGVRPVVRNTDGEDGDG